MPTPERWFWIDVDGRRVEVAVADGDGGRVLRMRVDGTVVAERPTSWRKQVLEHDDVRVEVEPLTAGRIHRARVLPPAADGEAEGDADGDGDDAADRGDDWRTNRLRSPVGSLGARLDDYADAHPWFVVVRHLGGAGVGVVLPILGLGVLLRALLPHVDVSLPDWLPSIDLPSLPDPLGWLWRLLPDVDLPTVSAPGWVEAVVESWRWWGPFAIALVVALGEVDRRRKRRVRDEENAAAARRDDGSGAS